MGIKFKILNKTFNIFSYKLCIKPFDYIIFYDFVTRGYRFNS